MDKIQKKWEFYGENDPYYAVATFDEFKSENLTEDTKKNFFDTGEGHIKNVWNLISRHFIEDFRPKNALDFGCGVGRLVVPLSSRTERITGVDISNKMLEEAKKNCEKYQINNAAFHQTDDYVKSNEKFDFIHSFIVFQHINPKIGINLIEKMLESLDEEGIGLLHVTYFNKGNLADWIRFKIYRDYPIVNNIKNILLRRKQDPFIPMYLYDLNNFMELLQKHNCHNCVVNFSDHGFNGIVLLFQKKKNLIF